MKKGLFTASVVCIILTSACGGGGSCPDGMRKTSISTPSGTSTICVPEKTSVTEDFEEDSNEN